jgi:hypothetical protein
MVRAAFWVLTRAAICDDNKAAKSVAARLRIAVSVSLGKEVGLFDPTPVVVELNGDQNESLIIIASNSGRTTALR